MKMSSCPAMFIPAEEAALPAPRSRTNPRASQAATPGGGCSRQSCPLPHTSKWSRAHEQQGQRLPCNQERGGRKPKVGARCAPATSPAAAHLLLHPNSTLQLQPSQGHRVPRAIADGDNRVRGWRGWLATNLSNRVQALLTKMCSHPTKSVNLLDANRRSTFILHFF